MGPNLNLKTHFLLHVYLADDNLFRRNAFRREIYVCQIHLAERSIDLRSFTR